MPEGQTVGLVVAGVAIVAAAVVVGVTLASKNSGGGGGGGETNTTIVKTVPMGSLWPMMGYGDAWAYDVRGRGHWGGGAGHHRRH